MTRGRPVLTVLAVLAAAPLGAMYIQPDIDWVPVDRVVANLERQVEAAPTNVELLINLARVHAMAFAQKVERTAVGRPHLDGKARPGDTAPTVENLVPFFGFGPPHEQFALVPAADRAALAAARKHLDRAIARFRDALAVAPDDLVARLGLGWTLSQAGNRAGAVDAFRAVVSAAYPVDRTREWLMADRRSLTEEAVLYLVPLLDPVADQQEIAGLRQQMTELRQRPRLITPIAIPLADGLTAFDVHDDLGAVQFDADGSGLPRRWTWIRNNAAWLVFDRQGAGRITSGLQLFGNVTFWLFWQNGYGALAALDDNGDGAIAGRELESLALWHDRNGNGISDHGEVRGVGAWGIVSLSTAYAYDPAHPDEIAWSSAGVSLRDGTVRPTFDLVLHERRQDPWR